MVRRLLVVAIVITSLVVGGTALALTRSGSEGSRYAGLSEIEANRYANDLAYEIADDVATKFQISSPPGLAAENVVKDRDAQGREAWLVFYDSVMPPDFPNPPLWGTLGLDKICASVRGTNGSYLYEYAPCG